jgi:hypothetical protein
MVTAVPPDQPLAYTRRLIFVSASVHAYVTHRKHCTELQKSYENLQPTSTQDSKQFIAVKRPWRQNDIRTRPQSNKDKQ